MPSQQVLFAFGLHGLVMIYYYHKTRAYATPNLEAPAELPLVTVQLPVFNEVYVIERLVNAVCEMEYPKDKLEIQLLDDSTDETVEVSRRLVAEWAARGFDIKHIHRIDHYHDKDTNLWCCDYIYAVSICYCMSRYT